jgi:hypothetical protein
VRLCDLCASVLKISVIPGDSVTCSVTIRSDSG